MFQNFLAKPHKFTEVSQSLSKYKGINFDIKYGSNLVIELIQLNKEVGFG